MDSFFYHTFTKIKQHRLVALLLAFLAITIIGFTASRITFEEDIMKLLPATEETRALQKILKSVNFSDKIIVTISKQKDGTIDNATDYATVYLDSLQRSASMYVQQVDGAVGDNGIDLTLDFIYKNLPQFLDEADYISLANRLNSDSIASLTESNYKTLISPSGIIAKKSIIRDPLSLSFMGLKKLQELNVGDDFTIKNGYLVSKDEEHVLLFITPQYAADDAANNEVFTNILYSIRSSLNTQFENKANLKYYGAALLAVENARQIKGDIQLTLGIALTVLMLIFILFYRKIYIPLILFAPTIVGALVSIAVLYLIRHQISAISLGIGSILLGVTLDYSLHILTHIRNESNIKQLYKEIAKPILMSSLTTALAFLCLLFLDSQALQDLGIFAAVSVITASIVALLFIPQMYKNSAKDSARSVSVKRNILDRISNYSFEKNKIILVSVAGLCVMSLFTYNTVKFNNDLETLNYEPQDFKEAKKTLDALTNIESKSLYAIGYSSAEDSVLQVNDAIFLKLKALKNQGVIKDYSSVSAIVNSESKQQENINRWNRFWTIEKKETFKSDLIESSAALGFKPTTFNTFYKTLDNNFKPLSPEAFDELPAINLDDFVNERDGLYTANSIIKLDEAQIPEVEDAFEGFENMVLIDRKAMNESLLGSLRDDFNKLIGYSLIVVIVLLLLFYRSLSLTLVTVLPVFLTWLVTIGIMGVLDIQFNIFNIIISTFIFGLGIDYSIFVTNGLLHELKTGEPALATHKTSILLSVLTTILGIGVLIFAKHPALYTISIVSIIGILMAMILAFTLQPLLFKLFIGSRNKRPIHVRYLIHSILSFTYFGLGAFLLSILGVLLIPILPFSKKKSMPVFHKLISKLMKSVLYTNPFVDKTVLNPHNETFIKPAFLIANHTSFLDILAIGMLTPKLIFLVNDWVYNSPIFGRAVKLAGFYPVSKGIEEAVAHLQPKVDQGYSLIAFPEGTRSKTNRVKRFHKGAFFLAETLKLDIIPVLIHGNSEVLPKGSFIIKDGKISVEILKRIPHEATQFGDNYSAKTKNITAYFRKEFFRFRNTIESPTYFYKTILEDYRFKGQDICRKVKQELKVNKQAYYSIINTIPATASILQLSNDTGALSFLLALDGAQRKITQVVSNEELLQTLKNSFITNTERKLFFVNSFSAIEHGVFDVLIVNGINISEVKLKPISFQSLNFIFLLHSPQLDTKSQTIFDGFELMETSTTLSVFKNTSK
ncbi:glycerol acyltransferase [Patiriisocius marinus]|uniref:Glycerol acyltransferase n=1 Tax=Patiriisocius marinus TaxID=1397112 RepID=A0A5J4IUF6_9FLAO|nr:MMPL family transporter [Patiriisocius marinus]GER58316.1 glycerol acyltransferase [Patiriisocius marinus]